MFLQDQLLLMGGIAGLYLYDSALLLFHNEIVLETKRDGYIVSSGQAPEIVGRYLFLPNPCCPHRALMRLSWPDNGVADARGQLKRWMRARLALSAIAPWARMLLGLFFLGLPCALWIGKDVLLLSWLVLTYLTIIAMLTQVYQYRQALNLSPRAVAGIMFDVLLCAPFAMNIVRKISLRQAPPSNLSNVASSMLSAAENAMLAEILRKRIQVSLNLMEPGSEVSDTLHAYLARFEDYKP